MKKEFISSKGKVIIERDTLYIRNTIYYFWDTGIGRISRSILPPLCIILILVFDTSEPFKIFTRVVMFACFTFLYSMDLFNLIFRYSYSNRIPLKRIVSIDSKEDENGLETNLFLLLKNGRKRKIAFRTLEHQHEGFISEISSFNTNLTLA